MNIQINKIELTPSANKYFPANWVANVTKGEMTTEMIVGQKGQFRDEASVRTYLEYCFESAKGKTQRMNDSITMKPSICLTKN